MPDKPRHLVVHDYGMGGVWWWVRAASPEEIVETIAEVEVVADPSGAGVDTDALDEADLDALTDELLIALRDRRTAQRSRPGYGVLAGRERVYLRDDDEEYEGVAFLSEVGPDGRRLRQVELFPDGAGVRSDEFPIDPPVDLRDPRYLAMEIDSRTFEDAWRTARDEEADIPPGRP